MPANDIYSGFDDASTSSRAPFPITPSDAVPMTPVPKAIYVGGGGNITLRGVDSAVDVVLVGVPVGSILPIRPSYIRAAGTTATNLVGLY